MRDCYECESELCQHQIRYIAELENLLARIKAFVTNVKNADNRFGNGFAVDGVLAIIDDNVHLETLDFSPPTEAEILHGQEIAEQLGIATEHPPTSEKKKTGPIYPRCPVCGRAVYWREDYEKGYLIGAEWIHEQDKSMACSQDVVCPRCEADMHPKDKCRVCNWPNAPIETSTFATDHPSTQTEGNRE
jgi:hypothetical protein